MDLEEFSEENSVYIVCLYYLKFIYIYMYMELPATSLFWSFTTLLGDLCVSPSSLLCNILHSAHVAYILGPYM